MPSAKRRLRVQRGGCGWAVVALPSAALGLAGGECSSAVGQGSRDADCAFAELSVRESSAGILPAQCVFSGCRLEAGATPRGRWVHPLVLVIGALALARSLDPFRPNPDHEHDYDHEHASESELASNRNRRRYLSHLNGATRRTIRRNGPPGPRPMPSASPSPPCMAWTRAQSGRGSSRLQGCHPVKMRSVFSHENQRRRPH